MKIPADNHKRTAKTVAREVQAYLLAHPEGRELKITIAQDGAKVRISRVRSRRPARHLPDGYFDRVYTAELAESDNAIAKSSVIDPADFR